MFTYNKTRDINQIRRKFKARQNFPKHVQDCF